MDFMKNIRLLYAARFFHNLIPAYVIERLFNEQRGFSIQMIVYAEIIYAVTTILLEIPTGVFADKHGRKGMLVLDAIFGSLEFLILIYATHFWQFALVVFLSGIGNAASSGSENALLYDSLLKCGRANEFEKHLGRLNAFDFSAIIIASLSGGVLAGLFNYEFNYWISFGSMLVSLFLTTLLVEPPLKTKGDVPLNIGGYVKDSFLFFKGNPGVCAVLITGIVTGASLNYVDEFWQNYAERLNIPVVYFGLLVSAFMILKLPGSIFAHALKERMGYRTLLTLAVTVFTAGFICVSSIDGYAGLIAIFLMYLVSGIMEPLTAGYLHHRIDSSVRATLDSFQSLGLRTGVIMAGLGFGFFSSRYDILGGYGFIAVVITIFAILFLVFSKRVDM